MKLLVSKFLLVITLLVIVSQLHAAEMKVASVDVRNIFTKWDFAAEMEVKLKEASEDLEKENKERLTVIGDYQTQRGEIYQEYESNEKPITLSEKEKLDLKFLNLGREAIALEQNRRDFYRKAKKKLEVEFANQSKNLLKRIAEEIRNYAEKNDYDMVVEMGGKTTAALPMFLHLDEAEDITDIIIKRLNSAE